MALRLTVLGSGTIVPSHVRHATTLFVEGGGEDILLDCGPGALQALEDTGKSYRHLHRICRKAGLRKIGWHVLRHTFASHLAMRGVPLRGIQELLGHASITMTMKYAHLSPDARRDYVQLLDEKKGNGRAMEKAAL